MKIYFLSSMPCALFLNGAYFGLTDLFERFLDVQPKDGIFAEFIPENALPIRFFITENLRFSPPDGCEVYLLKDGIAVYAKDFPPKDVTLQVLSQVRKNGLLATLFKQGRLQLSVEENGELFLANLPVDCAPSGIEIYRSLILLRETERLTVFNSRAELLLCEKIINCQIDGDEITALLPLSDRLGRVAECTWKIENGSLTRTRFTVKQRQTDDGTPEGLIAYAFFESVLIGAPFEQFLNGDLQEKAAELGEFLGDFIAVTLTDKENEIGLVYEKTPRIFELRYFRVEIKNGQICDIVG